MCNFDLENIYTTAQARFRIVMMAATNLRSLLLADDDARKKVGKIFKIPSSFFSAAVLPDALLVAKMLNCKLMSSKLISLYFFSPLDCLVRCHRHKRARVPSKVSRKLCSFCCQISLESTRHSLLEIAFSFSSRVLLLPLPNWHELNWASLKFLELLSLMYTFHTFKWLSPLNIIKTPLFSLSLCSPHRRRKLESVRILLSLINFFLLHCFCFSFTAFAASFKVSREAPRVLCWRENSTPTNLSSIFSLGKRKRTLIGIANLPFSSYSSSNARLELLWRCFTSFNCK